MPIAWLRAMAEQSSLTVVRGVTIERGASSGPALVVGKAAKPVRAESVALARRASAAQAFAVIATSCVRQIALNGRGVREGSGEAVHQMRVGLRRFRAALAIFKHVLPPFEFDGVKQELVWLTERLAPAREFDVLGQIHRRFIEAPGQDLAAQRALEDWLGRRREATFADARLAVESAQFEHLIVSAAVRTLSREDDLGNSSARDVARKDLGHRTRRVLRRLRDFSRLSAEERHELRISVKKLRYASEFFASLFPDAKGARERFSRQLAALQEVLGRLNDVTAHQRIARELVGGDRDESGSERRVAYALGALIGNEQAELARSLSLVPKLRKRIAKAPRFWS